MVIDEWVNQSAEEKAPMLKNEVLIDMVKESDPKVELHDADALPPPTDVDEAEVDRVAPTSYKKALIGKRGWTKIIKAEIVGVGANSLRIDMMTKAVGPSMLSEKMQLIEGG